MLRTISIYLLSKLLTLITSNILLTIPCTSHLIHGRGLAIHSPNYGEEVTIILRADSTE
jgi:hypothetical protein